MNNQNGEIINQAYNIIKKTYGEIYRLTDEFDELLSEYDSSLIFDEEYSYGPKSLQLKSHHGFLYKTNQEDSELATKTRNRYFTIIVLLDDDGWDLKRVSLKDQPEIWIGIVDIKNRTDKIRVWDIYNLLLLDERKYFNNGELRVGGDVFEYNWMDDDSEGDKKEEWKGYFIGYPLVHIKDKESLNTDVLNKLFESIQNKK